MSPARPGARRVAGALLALLLLPALAAPIHAAERVTPGEILVLRRTDPGLGGAAAPLPLVERARTLVRLGDWDEIPRLIAGLRDDRLYTRSLCFEALQEATHETHGFDPRSADDVRESAVVRWERWWFARSGDGLLTTTGG